MGLFRGTQSRAIGWVILPLLLLSACLGTDPKKFAGVTGDETSTTSTDVTDNFVLQFAIRDTTISATNRGVVIQGRSSAQSNLFVNICGSDASKCDCAFFNENSPSVAIAAISKTVNTELNLFSCEIPSSVADADLDDITLVRITDNTGKINSGQLTISEQLELSQIIGTLQQNEINKIYSYTCARTFLEGSGISGGTIACPDGMNLALLGANYTYYLFQQVDLSTTNFNARGGDVFYNGDNLLCGLRIRQISCATSQTLRFGLSSKRTEIFKNQITLTASPTATGPTAVGFAAAADNNLNCPPGLVKIRPFQAVPPTYTGGFSNFVNNDGRLNDIQIDVSTASLSALEVRRQAPSATPCAAGICQPPAGGETVVQSTAYEALNPVICAIPANLLIGI